ncbi:MAG TPA: PRC-barrel domain-containing protein [Anaerolineales bacterium]|nr:PRC-barrel domain-containing protein [Anaerolineales bacterium]
MEFKQGAEVFSGDGEKIGTLSRVVIDPRTREVANLVVEKGLLFKTDKVIPVTLVDLDIEDRIVLKKTNQDILEDFPDFETSYYVPLDQPDNPYQDDIEASYLYPPLHLGWTAGGHLGYPVPEYVLKTEQDIPEGTVALEKGAKVISRDGEHVGNVEEIITESQGDRVTHFVVSEGFLLKEHKLVPAVWIAEVTEEEIHLSVNTGVFERLPEYQPTK